MGKQIVRSHCFFASVSTIIQSIIWATIHMACVLYHLNFITYQSKTYVSQGEKMFEAFFKIFLDPNQGSMLGFYMHAYNFIGVSFAYFFLTIIWLLVSCYLNWIAVKNKLHHVQGALVAWSVITLVLSLFDLVVFAFTMYDYYEMNEKVVKDNIYINAAYVAEMLITTRFGLLWVVNVSFLGIFAHVLIKKSYLSEDDEEWPGFFNKKLEAYNENTINSPKVSPYNGSDYSERGRSFTNAGYEAYDDFDTMANDDFDMFADVSTRPGNPRRSPKSVTSIPIPPPNPAYRISSPVLMQRRRHLQSSPGGFSDGSDLDSIHFNQDRNRHLLAY